MTELLEQAIARLRTLPSGQQNALAKLAEGLAAMILEELEDETLWDKAFANSQDSLAQLAAEAMAEHRAGKTEELDPEKL
jgi:hypothetical protein